MKILICAYACIPGQGREEGRGWNCPWHLAEIGHEVWVMTTAELMVKIEQVLASHPKPKLHFISVDHPAWMKRYEPHINNKFWGILRYLAWQRQAYDAAQQLDKEHGFDVVHHLTMASLQGGSWLWRLNKPFIFGPAGGGQVAPTAFKEYFLASWSAEAMRTFVYQRLIFLIPSLRKTFSHTDLVLVTNQDTAKLAQRFGARRVELFLDGGLPDEYFPQTPPTRTASQELRLLWVGKVIPRKALLLTLEALSKVNSLIPFKLTILGSGSLDHYVPGWIKEFSLEGKVECRGHVPWTEVKNAYLENDVFIFTSLRDSFGAQLLEAMSQALPVVTLDHHGAQDFIPNGAGIKVPVTNPAETISALAQAVEYMYGNPKERLEMGRIGYEFAKTQTWSKKALKISMYYQEVLPVSKQY
ncbi:MAG: glycosyltransferase [Symplocastrum torsivum CPER-KK1]|jgi:glycosyltransferase involved in cell wall biosynthesis|uniref:Glycosyltransferase n=1 Tax=Symplocastrum torsivum CPER-KK1 TaxID=450513 RepID=A0A951PSI5_9CYAN|nr:glycosyltransferase [Symplocastrum torsivum CPER-KK1]